MSPRCTAEEVRLQDGKGDAEVRQMGARARVCPPGTAQQPLELTGPGGQGQWGFHSQLCVLMRTGKGSPVLSPRLGTEQGPIAEA